MPDQYGRIGPKDIQGLQTQYTQATKFRQDQEDEAEIKATDKKIDEYLDQLSQGGDIDNIRQSDPEFNTKAAIAAQATWKTMQFNTLRLTKAQQEVDLGEDLASFRSATETAKRGLGLLDAGETKKGLTALLPIFNKELSDGNVAEVIQQDGSPRVRVTGPDGKTIENAEAMTEADVREFVGMMITPAGQGGQTNWIKAREKARQGRQAEELKSAYTPETTRATADGPDILVYSHRNSETGKKSNTYFHTGEQRELSKEEAEAMHLRPISYWREQALSDAVIKAKGLLLKGKKAAGEDKPLSTQGKFAYDLRDAYAFNKPQSMALATELMESVAIGKQVQKMMSEGYDPDEEEVVNVLNSKAAQSIIQKHLKRKYESERKSAKGLRKKGKASSTELKNLIAAKPVKQMNIPDGTTVMNGTYIVKNGRWTVNK